MSRTRYPVLNLYYPHISVNQRRPMVTRAHLQNNVWCLTPCVMAVSVVVLATCSYKEWLVLIVSRAA